MATSLATLFRSIPASVTVRDPNVRRLLDAITENLRRLQVDQATGQLYAGAATGAGLVLQNSGGGTPVIAQVDGLSIAARTIRAGSNISVSLSGGAILISATSSDPTDLDEKVAVAVGDTPGYLAAKLVNVGTAYPLLSYAATQGKVKGLLAGTGLSIAANDTDVQLSLDPVWVEANLDDHKVLCDAGDESAGYLADKAVSLAAAGTALLVADAVGHTVGVKGIADGTAIAFEDSGSDVEIHLAIGELGTESYDRATHTLLAWNGSTQARVQLPDYAALPAGTSGDVLYHNGTAWVASDLATLVAAILTGLSTATPTDSDYGFIKTAAGALRWAAIGDCTS